MPKKGRLARPGSEAGQVAVVLLFRRLAQGAAVALVLLLLGLLVWKVVRSGRGTRLVAEVKAGKRPFAPRFDLPVLWPHSATWPARDRVALSDGKLDIRELRGHPVVVNFWASWCGPCKSEAPLLVASAREHAGNVAFVGVDVQDFKSDARRFLRRLHTNYVAIRDGSGSTFAGYGLTGVPETYWIDRRGRIVDHYPGEISREQLEGGIQRASGAAP